MADNVAVTAGSGTSIAADEVVDGTLGTVKVQYVKTMDGTLDGTTKLGVYAEDAAAASDPTGTMLIAVRRDTLSTSEVSADGDNIALKATNKGKLHVAAELRLGDTVADTGSGTGGSATQRVIVDSSQLASNRTTQGAFTDGAQQVSLPSDHPAIPVTPAGNVAHDAADSGNPVKQGFKATSSLSGLTLVASADRTDGFAGLDGVQLVRTHTNLEDIISGVAAITDGSSSSVIAALGAGIKGYVTSAIIANTSATAVTVDLRDGAAGTVKATLPVPANTSGVVCNLPVPLPFSANTAICADPSAAASTVTVTLIGFKSKV